MKSNLFDENGLVKMAPNTSGSKPSDRKPKETRLDKEASICTKCTRKKCSGSSECPALMKELKKE